MASRLALFTLIAFASLVSISADGLLLKVTGPTQVDDISDLQIKTTLKNTGKFPLLLVDDPWSALSTAPTDKFSFSHESGSNPEFTGIFVKYSFDLAITSGAVTTLNPDNSIEVNHSLTRAYNFTNSGPGTYEISPSTIFHVISEAGNPEPINATLENSHKFIISASKRLLVPQRADLQKQDALLMKRAVFSGCTASQESQIVTAYQEARNLASDAFWHLYGRTTSSPRFTKWFGSFSLSSSSTVLAHFAILAGSSGFTTWTYHCTSTNCSPGVYGWGSSDVYGAMNLCPVFFDINMGRMRIQTGTLINVGTRFPHSTTSPTLDLVHSESACELLASNFPTLAIRNAESYEYFAENNPPLL